MDANFNNLNSGKQETLVSGGNIKQINGESILGGGNLVIDKSAGDEVSFVWTVELDHG
jgi:hypothetical protein